MDDLYKRDLPQARSIARQADAALMLAYNELILGSMLSLHVGRNAVDRVNRHFKLDKNPNWKIDLDQIRRIFRDMLALISRNTSGAEKTFVAGPGTMSATSLVFGSTAVAISFSGGRDLRGTTIQARDPQGNQFVIDQGTIIIIQPYQYATADARALTLVHEMAHYLGPMDPSPDAVSDYAYGSLEKMAKLSPKERARNADSYAVFAYECAGESGKPAL